MAEEPEAEIEGQRDGNLGNNLLIKKRGFVSHGHKVF